MLKIIYACLALFFTFPISARAGERYALIIGANDGGEARAKLRYASQDAANIADVLGTLGQFTKGTVHVLVQPTKAEVLKKLEDFARKMALIPDGAEFVLYYSGHADDYGLLLGKERLTYSHLKETAKNLPAKIKLLIIDACSSGTLSLAKGGARQAPFLLPLSQDAHGFAVMTSSSPNESSQESERLHSSFFTHYLLAGMRGAADSNEDHLITLSEAYSYANLQTMVATSKTRMGAQHPTFEFELKGRGDMILTDLRQQISSIEFPRDAEGTFYIRATTGSFFLEIHKKSGASESLAVEPGHYEIVQYAGMQYYHAEFNLSAQQRLSLPKIELKPIPAEKVAIRGDYEFPVFYEQKFIHFSLFPARHTFDGLQRKDRTALLHFSPLVGSIERLEGLGFGLIGHMTHDFKGVTAALAFNSNQGLASGAQLSLGATMTEDLRGLQLAPLNYAYQVHGVQVGLMNAGGLVNGVQFGVINVADSVDGTQFGLLNYAERSEGLSFAPIMIVKSGILRAEVWTDSTTIPQLGFRSGTPYFYSTFFVGQGHTTMLGMGPGLRLPYQDKALSLDISWALYRQKTTAIRQPSIDGGFTEGPTEEQLRNLLRIRFFYEWAFTRQWNGMFGVSRVTQHFTTSEKRRVKNFGPLLLQASERSASEQNDVGLILGVSYSLLEGHL